MNLATSKPFPLPVVAFGPGSQNEGDAGPAYLDMPKGMDTFHAPRLPDNATPAALLAAADWLAQFCTAAENAGLDAGYSDDLGQLDPLVREVLNQSLAFGEVSAFTSAPEHWRAQETAFAGFWRVLQLDGDSRILSDRLQAARIPPQLISAMQASTQPELAAPDYPPGTMNAPALVEELRQAAAAWQAGQPAHVVNLTLLPVSEADLDTLYTWLGHREVSLLSRGYGNCRITSTRLRNVWWVQYFNSMDALILNTLEVVDMPEVALAADEDFADSLERLREYLSQLREDA